jgi:phage FluMu protein Com
MAIRFRCPCGSKLLVPENFAGRQVRCPACRQFNAVPSASDAQTESRSAAPPVARSSTAAATEQTTSKSVLDTDSSGRSQPLHEPFSAAQPSPVVPPEASVAASPTPRPSKPVSEAVSFTPPLADEAWRSQVKVADERLVATARLLGWALTGIALVGLLPAWWEITTTFQAVDASSMGRWVYVLIWLTVMHGAYAIYLGQLPDTSSLWMVTLFTLGMATFYAGLLGITLVVRPETTWLADLDLLEHLQGRRATGWCFIMLCLESLLSYLSGRASFRWSSSTTGTQARSHSTGR